MNIDILPTLAALTGAKLPPNKIDGLNILPLMQAKPGVKTPHDAFWFYYNVNDLEAIRVGKWKLQFPHTATQMVEGHPVGADGRGGPFFTMKVPLSLYDLETDPGERNNVIDEHPDVVKMIQVKAEVARTELGDGLTKRPGTERREPGKWDVPLAEKIKAPQG
jgi:arylsulfatase A-like enzyme